MVLVFLANILTRNGEICLKENGQVGYGRFSASKLFKGSTSFKFEYEVDGHFYSGTNYSVYQVFKNQEMLKGKLLPVIYDPENPENAKMLISKFDFEKFDRVRPDSLKWLCSSAGICE